MAREVEGLKAARLRDLDLVMSYRPSDRGKEVSNRYWPSRFGLKKIPRSLAFSKSAGQAGEAFTAAVISLPDRDTRVSATRAPRNPTGRKTVGGSLKHRAG
jgi:hypothetical protein